MRGIKAERPPLIKYGEYATIRRIMNIGEIKHALKGAEKNAQVFFDFTNCVPTTVHSWRGIYAEPAIGWRSTESMRAGDSVPTVESFLRELNIAIEPDREYAGWKGGSFSYDDNSPLHVDNPGMYTCTEIVRIAVNEYRVTLITEIVE